MLSKSDKKNLNKKGDASMYDDKPDPSPTGVYDKTGKVNKSMSTLLLNTTDPIGKQQIKNAINKRKASKD